jgi:hypothetical protein
VFAIIVGLFIWLASGPEGGVRTLNNMEQYAWDYIEKHNLLNSTEELVAYYDVTVFSNSSECAILTTERLIYHKDGRSTQVNIQDIADVQHHYESLIGDVIEVKNKSGVRFRIEIAPFNGGETFYNALMDVVSASGI